MSFIKIACCLLMTISIHSIQNQSGKQNSIYIHHNIEQVFKYLPLEYLYKLYDEHPESHAILDSYFRVKRIINVKKTKKLLTYSLFWKPQDNVNQETIHEKRVMKGRITSFYELYVEPLKRTISYFKKHEPKTRFRIYLASDLEFLITDLSSPNVEIFLMESSSIGHSPGAMWRFLAFGDKNVKWVCCQDSDEKERRRDIPLINKWLHDHSTTGFYRIHSTKSSDVFDHAIYSPIIANCFGAKRGHGIDFEKAMKGFILHRELFLDEDRHPQDTSLSGHPYGFGNHFPVYGFDERFLKHVIYFHLAKKAQLSTLVSSHSKKEFLKNKAKGIQISLLSKDYCYVLGRNKHAIYE